MSATLEQQIKERIVATLELKIRPEEIGDEDPLFVEGVGLDSVDALEIAAMLSSDFDVEITDKDEAQRVFASVKTIAEHIRKTSAA